MILTGSYLGAAQATLDEMLAFAKTRYAFGRPIGTFQALGTGTVLERMLLLLVR